MLLLFKFIFWKSFYVCIRIFKEREFPWFFASSVVSLTLGMSIVTILETYQYLMLPDKVNIYEDYFGYFSLVMLTVIALSLKNKGRYLKVLSDIENIAPGKKLVLRNFAIAYFIVLLVGFFLVGALLKENNMMN